MTKERRLAIQMWEQIVEALEQGKHASSYARPIASVIKDAFTTGFQAGRPVWHDLRKDKNDLPDILCYVWTNVGAGYYDGNHWRDDFGRLRNVVAWCEPKFEED